MSNKTRPQYADQKGIIVEGFDGKSLLAEGATVPTNGTAGYAPGSLFIKRAGAVGAAHYINEGSATSSLFRPAGAGPVSPTGAKFASGVATITGSGDVVTGLTTVTAVVVTQQSDASLTNGISVTATIGNQAGAPAAGSITIKVWKPTASGDVTPIASAAAIPVNWVAFGT